VIDFYTWHTGNGMRVAIALNEVGLDYIVRPVRLSAREHLAEEFRRLNPLGRIPVIVDHDGPDGERLVLTQSAAILLYLADKTGLLLSKGRRQRAEELESLSMIMTDLVAPLGAAFFARAGDRATVTAIRRRAMDVLPVVNQLLEQRTFIGGSQMSIADCVAFPIMHSLEPITIQQKAHLARWKSDMQKRTSVQAALRLQSDLSAA
jgi:GST-like protein